jgi:hypothetical protein
MVCKGRTVILRKKATEKGADWFFILLITLVQMRNFTTEMQRSQPGIATSK